MLGTVDAIDYDGDRVRTVVLRFPPLRSGDSEIIKEVRPCERIGQGSFGTVYRAVCGDYPRLALKISTGKSTRLRQELEVLSRVCTKGRLLLPRFEFGALNRTADLIVIGMELCVPSTLHDLLLSTRITSEAEMLFIAHQAVQAVSYVHMEGCIHRDIKLQNYVFDLDGNLKLIDFGLACNSLKPPPGDVVAGTVSFMSPEMAHNALHKDKRVSVGVAADVWSLGIVLFSIFTQRNPYPSTETPAQAACSASGAAGHSDATSAVEGEKGNAVSQRQRMNERLLRRVAAGDWQWPVGITVSQDLKQLVNSILVTNPEERPSVDAILANKLWNLRRRYPPAAVAAFLGVQDDFLLSHDEAHLMRAVEERSAGVAASLLNSRLNSPSLGSSGEDGETDAQHSSGGSARNGGLHVSDTATPTARSSLKVVQRCGEGGVDGAVAVQVYDVRASTRKHSKPIREISVVMAEETAKTRRSKSARRAKSGVSAPSSRVASRASSTEGNGRSASSAGAAPQHPSAHARADSGNDECEEGEVVSLGISASQHDRQCRTPVRVQPALDTAGAKAGEQRSGVCHPYAAAEPSCATPPLLAPDMQQGASKSPCGASCSGRGREQSRLRNRRSASVELLEDAKATIATSSKATSHSRAASGSPRKRDRSLRQPSSSILIGEVRDLPAKAPPSTATTVSALKSAFMPKHPIASSLAAEDLLPSPSRQASLWRPGPQRAVTPSSTPRRAGHTGAPAAMKRAQRVALELSVGAVWQDEADNRRMLSAMLLIEHAWLLASFRLTIEEDQERYNIMWLAEEQEKSAAHPHRFREVTQVVSKKYQYGFVCDMCDYEFLPSGPEEKDLHFFHCPCGRDLCPDCYSTYQRQCTCPCCLAVHPNSCVLREHLLQTGGTQHRSGSRKAKAEVQSGALPSASQAAASLNEKASGYAAPAPPVLPRRRGRPPKQDKNCSPVKLKGSRATKDTGRRRRCAQDALGINEDEVDEVAQIPAPRVSIAALQQREGRSSSSNGPCRGAVAVSHRPEDVDVKQRPVGSVPAGPWRPFARFKKDRQDEAARQPTPEERDALLNGEWIRHFYLFPHPELRHGTASGTRADEEAEGEEPYAFVYHAQPGRTGAIFLTSDFPMHSAVFSMLERQFFVVDQVDTLEGADATRATSLLRAKGHPDLRIAFHALQDIVAYDTNMMKQQRTPGTVSVYQAPRSAYSCNGEPFLYVRWFRFNENRTLSAFLLSHGGVQVFVNNEYELRWFDEHRKFLIRYNGVCELVDDSTFALAPAINHLLYDSFDA
ncbi:hypothetical protein LSCM1_01169 [Leishmania martiniquensis]|uniref:Protein kinase domain-containing protein n=1 Tax=Leishmania martiniquensis TaxID=1580590 RepID=A0A836GXL0_9TRYP|nr:hypothetical protein LSCM1_01169 [Leishmania martiniquensis]